MTRGTVIGLAAFVLLSCGDEPLPPVRSIHPEPVLVEGWQIPDADGLRVALVREYLAEEAAASIKAAYCVQFCDCDRSKEQCRAYDPPVSFFSPFRSNREPIFPSYACPSLAPPYTITMRMVVGPFWRRPEEKDLIAEVGVSPPSMLPDHGAEYAAAWGVGGWRVQLRTAPPP